MAGSMNRVVRVATIGSTLVLAAAFVAGSLADTSDEPAVSLAQATANSPADELQLLDGALAQAEPPEAHEKKLGPSKPARGSAVGDPDRRRRRPGRPLTTKLVEQCLEVARDVEPELANRLEKLRQENPGPAFERAIRNARHLRGLVDLKQRDPQVYQLKVKELRLDAQIDSVLKQLAGMSPTSSEAAETVEAHVRGLVRQQVAASIASRGMYLLRLKENLTSLQEQLAYDAANFEEAVERRMRALIEEADLVLPAASESTTG
ncbi:MAG: hypothetical protein IH983_14205 [Planctomycetes bacterium]|nr:hypothetical protein [Planctomycetota bacterium]